MNKKIIAFIGFISIILAAYFIHQKYMNKLEDRQIAMQFVESMHEQALLEPKLMIEVTSPEILHDILTNKKEQAILFFHMDGCGWCKKMEPVYQEIAQNPTFANIQFYSVNGKDCNAQVIVKELIDQQINGYPTLIFMNESGYLGQQVGFADQAKFEQKIRTVFFGEDLLNASVEEKEATNGDNVKIQGCRGLGQTCNAKVGTDDGDCCSGLTCAACQGQGRILAAHGSNGYCQNSCNDWTYCGYPINSNSCEGYNTGGGANSENQNNSPCIGAIGNIFGFAPGQKADGKNTAGNNSGCAPNYICAVDNGLTPTGTSMPAKHNQDGVCSACGYFDSSGTMCMWNGSEVGYYCSNQQQCTGGASGVLNGGCCSGYECLTTNTGTTSEGSYLELAGSGQYGACFLTTGMTTTGAKATVNGKSDYIYISGGASGDYGTSGHCSTVNQVCVGAYEGSLGTCCQDDGSMDCIVDTAVAAYGGEHMYLPATYGELGVCEMSQASQEERSCIGGSTDQGNCPDGYDCLYESSEGYMEVAPANAPGYCVLNNKEYGTLNQCSLDGAVCVGGTDQTGTCCPPNELNSKTEYCLINNGGTEAYAEYAQVGYCSTCVNGNGASCQYQDGIYNGTCCPGFYCYTDASNSSLVSANGKGVCGAAGKTSVGCDGEGKSCTAAQGSTLGTCCPDENLVCAENGKAVSYNSNSSIQSAGQCVTGVAQCGYSGNSCTATSGSNVGNCCPNAGLICANSSGTAITSGYGTCTVCPTSGQSCNYVSGSTAGTCCPGTGLTCANSSGVAITKGTGTCQ